MVDLRSGGDQDGFGVPLRLYNVLLALAGRLDDSALSEARELVARSNLDDATELTVGSLVAGRLPVRPAEQRELASLLELTRSDPTLADPLTVVEDIAATEHRFSREDDPDTGVGDALDRVLRVLPDLRSVHAVWRNTAAGSVPGPLPQRVVLVDIGPDAHPPAVAFRVGDALRKAGIRAVVEVTGPGSERTAYHEAALSAGVPVWLAGPDSARHDSARAESVRAEPAHAEPAPAPTGPASVPPPPEPQHQEPQLQEPQRSVPAAPEHPPAVAAVPEAPTSDGAVRDDSPVREQPAAPAPEPAPSSRGWTAEPPRSARSSGEPGRGRRSRHPARTQAEPPENAGGELPRGGEGGQVVEFPQPQHDVEQENRSAQTTEMSREEVAQLRAAIAEDRDKGQALASADLDSDQLARIPDLNLDDPQLTDRDRELLRELHAELAERERAEAQRQRTNGTSAGGADAR
ncbi:MULTISPECIES: hypothetical protein [Prauserella salsuginis group]|uniref:Uncharacterized protein n=1 Tax=Prauserella salsuginis TaxID=387889 RepID=A0ABW6FZA2_9PSEU|nr:MULTISPECIES: hypothetical protein [Prauserella salsuginis group]MCR3720923.1 hypothetical protein [Prauserella flava]MCR3734996.1 hypothetical protein [Prauserella salsuginis]